MKPPICEHCSTDFRTEQSRMNRQGGLVRFADYQPLPTGMVGHPRGLGWFCHLHLNQAQQLTTLTMADALHQLNQSLETFAHVILTRFNLRMWRDVNPNDDWLAHRLDLFEQFCYPSVLGQKNQNFTWLLLFDETTPVAFRPRIERYAEPTNVKVLYTAGFDLQAIIREVGSYTTADQTHLISTTLDNDDALAEEYVQVIQSQFRGQQFELLNVVSGLRYDVVGGKLYTCTVQSNPFISLIEQKNVDQSLMTIAACLPHSTIAKRFPQVTNLKTPPLWMQVVHERNLEITNLAGRKRVSLAMLTKRFHLKHPHAHLRENANVIRLQNVRARAERVMIDALPDEFKLKLRAQLSKYLRR